MSIDEQIKYWIKNAEQDLIVTKVCLIINTMRGVYILDILFWRRFLRYSILEIIKNSPPKHMILSNFHNHKIETRHFNL